MPLHKPEVNSTHESSFPAFSLIFRRFWSSLIVQQGAVGLRMLHAQCALLREAGYL